MVPIRTRYDIHKEDYKNPDKGTHFDATKRESKSLTRQADKDGTDLNKLLAPYEKTGQIPVDLLLGTTRAPMYGDFTGLGDYHLQKSRIAAADQAFEALPASVRNRFDNDVKKLCDFLANPANDAEARKLGLREPLRNDENTPPANFVAPVVKPPAAPPAPPAVPPAQ